MSIVKYLVNEKKANIESKNNCGCTPLYIACQMGNLEVVKFLVNEKKANIESKDIVGCTPILLHVNRGDSK